MSELYLIAASVCQSCCQGTFSFSHQFVFFLNLGFLWPFLKINSIYKYTYVFTLCFEPFFIWKLIQMIDYSRKNRRKYWIYIIIQEEINRKAANMLNVIFLLYAHMSYSLVTHTYSYTVLYLHTCVHILRVQISVVVFSRAKEVQRLWWTRLCSLKRSATTHTCSSTLR